MLGTAASASPHARRRSQNKSGERDGCCLKRDACVLRKSRKDVGALDATIHAQLGRAKRPSVAALCVPAPLALGRRPAAGILEGGVHADRSRLPEVPPTFFGGQ